METQPRPFTDEFQSDDRMSTAFDDQKEHFIHYVRRFALQPGDFLERQILEASARFSVYNLFAKKPISLSLRSTPQLLLLWATMIALSPNRFLFDSTLWDSNSAYLHSRFARFSVLMTRNGSTGQDGGFTGEAGLLMNGCYLEPASSHRTGNRIVKEYEQPVAFNGWFLRNGYDSPVTDMSLVMLEISKDGESWNNLAVSKPYCSLIRDSSESNYQGIEMPTTRGGEVVFDFTSSWCMTPTILVAVARLIEVFSLMLGFLFVWHGSGDLMLVSVMLV